MRVPTRALSYAPDCFWKVDLHGFLWAARREGSAAKRKVSAADVLPRAPRARRQIVLGKVIFMAFFASFMILKLSEGAAAERKGSAAECAFPRAPLAMRPIVFGKIIFIASCEIRAWSGR
jgi:hypothetical protein